MVLWALVAFAPSCGIRQVREPGGAVRTELLFGLTATPDCAADPGLSAEVTVLGAWSDASGGGLGYHRGRYVCGSPRCQVVIWPGNSIDPAALRRELGDLDGICIAP